MSEIVWEEPEMIEGDASLWEVVKRAHLGDGFQVVAGVSTVNENLDPPQKAALAIFAVDTPLGTVPLSREILAVAEEISWEECSRLVQEFWDSRKDNLDEMLHILEMMKAILPAPEVGTD